MLKKEDLPYVSGHSVSEHLQYCIDKYCPSKSLEDNNVISAYGSDFPVYMPNALSDIQTALTRRVNPKIPNYEKK